MDFKVEMEPVELPPLLGEEVVIEMDVTLGPLGLEVSDDQVDSIYSHSAKNIAICAPYIQYQVEPMISSPGDSNSLQDFCVLAVEEEKPLMLSSPLDLNSLSPEERRSKRPVLFTCRYSGCHYKCGRLWNMTKHETKHELGKTLRHHCPSPRCTRWFLLKSKLDIHVATEHNSNVVKPKKEKKNKKHAHSSSGNIIVSGIPGVTFQSKPITTSQITYSNPTLILGLPTHKLHTATIPRVSAFPDGTIRSFRS